MTDVTINTLVEALKKIIIPGKYSEIFIKHDGIKITNFEVKSKFKYDEEVKNIYK
jgi:3-phosphoglycerate kinase